MELRSEISKQDLSISLVELMKNKKYSEISIQNIIEKAGYSRMAYYRNFNNKDDVLKYYIKNITDAFVNESKINYDNLLFQEYLIQLFEHLYEWKDFEKLLHKNNLLHFIKTEFDRAFEKKAKNSYERYHYLFVSGGLFNIFQVWLLDDFKKSPKELSELFYQFSIK